MRRFPGVSPWLSSVKGVQVRRFWQLAVPVIFVVTGLTGKTSLIRIGYLLVTFSAEALRQLNLTTLSEQCWTVGLVYTGGALYLMYMFQFEEVADKLDGRLAGFNASQIGLEAQPSQRDRAEYLVFPFVVFGASMLRARIAASKAAVTPPPPQPAETARPNASPDELDEAQPTERAGLRLRAAAVAEMVVVHALRLFWLESDKAIVLLAFASAVFGTPTALCIVTVILVLLSLLHSGAFREVLFGGILIWFEVVIVMKLLSKLIRPVDQDVDTLVWVGIGPHFDVFGTHEILLLVTIVAVAFRKRLRSQAVERWLWPDVAKRGDRTLLGWTPPSRSQSYLMYVVAACNHAFELYGSQICVITAVVVAFVRLNVVGLCYLLLAPYLGSDRRGTLRAAFLLVATLIFLQSVVVIGFPPRYTIPWEEWSTRNSTKSYKAVMRWTFIPPMAPLHYGDTNTDDDGDGFESSNIVEWGPLSWRYADTLFADMVLLLFIAMRMRSHKSRTTAAKGSADGNDEETLIEGMADKVGGGDDAVASDAGAVAAASDAIGVSDAGTGTTLQPSSGWATTSLMFMFQLTVLFFATFAGLSRRDLLCLGYFWIVIKIASVGGTITRKPVALQWWDRLRRYNYLVLVLHMLWVLPAVALFGQDYVPDPDSSLPWVLGLFGLRRGHSVVLYQSDDRISVWSVYGNGMVWDVVLFALNVLHGKAIGSDLFALACDDFKASSAMAASRVDDFVERQRVMLRDLKAQEEQQANHVRETMDSLKDRTGEKSFSEFVNDQATINDFAAIDLNANAATIDLYTAAESAPDVVQEHVKGDAAGVGKDREKGGPSVGPNDTPKGDGSSTSTKSSRDDDAESTSSAASVDGDSKQSKLRAAQAYITKKALALTNWLLADSYPYRLLAMGPPQPRAVTTEELQLWSLLAAAGWSLVTRTHLLCYLGALVAVASTANLLGIVYAVLIFCWGALQPGLYPSARFFKVLGWYACFNIVVRYIFRCIAKAWLRNDPDFTLGNDGYRAYTDDIGLTRAADCSTKPSVDECNAEDPNFWIPCRWDVGESQCTEKFGFQLDLLPDVALLMSILLHRYVQTRFGLWGEEEQIGGGKAGSSDTSGTATEVAVPTSASKGVVAAIKARATTFFSVLDGTEDAGDRDYYGATFAIQFVALITIIFGYSAFSEKQNDNVQQAVSGISNNNVPTSFLAYLIFQLVIIITDRVLYLLRALRAKLVFLVLTVLTIHALVFFYIPAVTGVVFHRNPILVLWYVELVIYLFLSALQIRSGYPSDVLTNVTYRTDVSYSDLTRVKLYAQLYFNIPFLYEARSILDWACSDTTLTMDEWLKLEDITKQLFFVQLKLITDEKEGRLFGEKQPRSAKATGALIFGLLIVILLSPLLAMSFLNTQSISNTPRYADSTLQLFTFEPLYTQENYPAEVNGSYYDVIKRNATGGMRDATQSDIDLTTFSTASQRTWGISPVSLLSLKDNLVLFKNKSLPVPITFSWHFRRIALDGVLTSVDAEGSRTTFLADAAIDGLVAMLDNATAPVLEGLDEVEDYVLLKGLFPAYHYLGATIDSTALRFELPTGFITTHDVDCRLRLSTEAATGRMWWSLEQLPSSALAWCPEGDSCADPNLSDGPQLVTFSARVAPPELSFLASYGVVALYVTGVLAVGRFLRMAFNDISQKIPYHDMPQVRTLQTVCHLIRLARARRPDPDLLLEERLFRLLISIYRSTEAMGLWTAAAAVEVGGNTAVLPKKVD